MASQARTQQKKKKIVKVASSLFSRHGFRVTTLDSIASKASMGKASLYYYFPGGKEAIFSAVVQAEAEIALQEIMEAVQKEKTPMGRLKTYLACRIQLFHKNILRHRLSDVTREELMPLAEQEIKEYLARELGLIEAMLDEGIRTGTFKDVNTQVVARIIQASLKSITTDRQIQEDEEVRKSEADSFLRFVLSGIHHSTADPFHDNA